jgi:hypothetical protein
MACGINWDAARTSGLLEAFNIGARATISMHSLTSAKNKVYGFT